MERRIVLFVSTGRCGTQWLASNLGRLYGEVADVTHEPIGPHYRPRSYFRCYDDPKAMLREPEIAAHVERVSEVTRHRAYIETGWPLFAAVPLFLQRYGGRVALVHLTRHPVPSSLSHMAHQCYGNSPRDDDYTRLAALDPFCPRVFQRDYQARWERLTPYEKCLFWWTEVHLFADELRRLYPDVPYLRVRSESLLGGDDSELRGLIDFIGLPWNDALAAESRARIDRWNHQTDIDFEWRRIHEHPRALEVSAALGYDLDQVDEQ